MNCKKAWAREIMDPNLTKTWVNKDLKSHRENILLDREKALLPATQPRVERQIKVEKYQNEMRKKREEIAAAKAKYNRLKNELWQMERKRWRIERGQDEDGEDGAEEKKERRKFVRACPQADCRGFLSTQYKCALCETWVCPQCNVIKESKDDPDHECDPNDVETVKYIKSQVKTCPKCGEGIQKVSGCDQMWCTTCKVAFSWRTNEIVHGTIHNPHFYEWQRQMNNGQAPRNRGDLPCGGLPWFDEIQNKLVAIYNITRPERQRRRYGGYWQPPYTHPVLDRMSAIHRTVSHIQNVEIPHYRRVPNVEEENVDLRINYLMKRIEEADWKKKLQMREKARDKNLAIFQVMDMYSATMSDLFRNILNSDLAGITQIDEEIQNLTNYVNTQFQVLRKRYNNRIPHIDQDFKFTKK
jgi:hypothetical protein